MRSIKTRQLEKIKKNKIQPKVQNNIAKYNCIGLDNMSS